MKSSNASDLLERFIAKMIGRKRHVTIGDYSRIHPLASLTVTSGGSIIVGSNSRIHRGAIVATYGGQIIMGNHCTVNPYSILYGHGGLNIGNYVRIATHCVLVPANHGFNRLDIPIARQEIKALGIQIDDDVWIGANSVILDGVSIGRGAVIGAGSVVTKSIDPFAICVGNPARPIGSRCGQVSQQNET